MQGLTRELTLCAPCVWVHTSLCVLCAYILCVCVLLWCMCTDQNATWLFLDGSFSILWVPRSNVAIRLGGKSPHSLSYLSGPELKLNQMQTVLRKKTYLLRPFSMRYPPRKFSCGIPYTLEIDFFSGLHCFHFAESKIIIIILTCRFLEWSDCFSICLSLSFFQVCIIAQFVHLLNRLFSNTVC